MPQSRARATLLTQADRLEAAPAAADPSAALRIALWRLDAGGRPDPATAIRGAHLARYAHDFRVVRRLTEAVPGSQLDAVGALLLGEALYELGEFTGAERVLADGQRLPASEQVALRLAVTRAKNAQWGLCDPQAALAVNAAARAVITTGSLAEELIADEASVLTFSGHPGQALSGRLAEAEQLARTGAETVATSRVPIAQIFFAANLGRVATLQGRLATARRYYSEATGLAGKARACRAGARRAGTGGHGG